MRKSSELAKTDVSENHQKIEVNATADVWQNRGGRTFRNRHGCSEKQIIIVFVKKALVFMRGTKSGVPTGTESHEGLTLFGEQAKTGPQNDQKLSLKSKVSGVVWHF